MIEISKKQLDVLMDKHCGFLNQLFKEANFKCGEFMIVFSDIPNDLLRNAARILDSI